MAISGGAFLANVGGVRAAETPASIGGFMEEFGVPGLSFAMAKGGRVVRREAHGLADLKRGQKMDPAHRFRIASISKPITSAAIFLLAERRELALDDLVLGEGGILAVPGPPGVTLRHLLTHTSGGWKNDGMDPMFKRPELDHAELIAWTLQTMPPKRKPGEAYAYSNFGYCLLGRVIEKVTGKPYEEFVREEVLSPCGAAAMTVGQGEREVSYYADGKPLQSTMNVPRMDSHGGWVATPSELLEFALRMDGFAEPGDLLGAGSLAEMTARGGVNPSYACGWKVNAHGNYWHGGSLPGLSSLLVRTAEGFCWAACANARSKGIGLALDRLMWAISKEI